MSTILLPDNSIQGTKGDDLLKGTSGSDLIFGQDGNDIVIAKQGNDILNGDNGQDFLSGGAGNDELDGGAGNDFLSGGTGNDFLTGGKGSDILRGGNGQDQIFGGDFNDSVLPFPDEPTSGNTQIDILFGGQDADRFILSTFGPADQPLQPYIGNGFAILHDFSRSEGDKIILLGSAEDYSFTNNSGNTEIMLGEDLIAVVDHAVVNSDTDVNFVSQFVI